MALEQRDGEPIDSATVFKRYASILRSTAKQFEMLSEDNWYLNTENNEVRQRVVDDPELIRHFERKKMKTALQDFAGLRQDVETYTHILAIMAVKDGLHSRKEVANLLHVHQATVARWVKEYDEYLDEHKKKS